MCLRLAWVCFLFTFYFFCIILFIILVLLSIYSHHIKKAITCLNTYLRGIMRRSSDPFTRYLASFLDCEFWIGLCVVILLYISIVFKFFFNFRISLAYHLFTLSRWFYKYRDNFFYWFQWLVLLSWYNDMQGTLDSDKKIWYRGRRR